MRSLFYYVPAPLNVALGVIGVMLKFWKKYKMEVVDQEPHSWFLFKMGNEFLFSANCEFSFVGYDFIMFLSQNEINKFNELGHEYLNELANAINVSVPISKTSKSIYKDRNVSSEYSEKFLDAVEYWCNLNGKQGTAT